MTLKEKVLNRKPLPKRTSENSIEKLQREIRYDKFLDICERIEKTISPDKIACNTFKDVFDLVEKYNIRIFDIIPEGEWDQFKKDMLKSRAQYVPMMGKCPDRVFDLSKPEDYIEYSMLKDSELL